MGGNKYGQLGDNTTDYKDIPTRIDKDHTTWASVTAGENHTMAIKTDGTLYAWGNNDIWTTWR